MSYLEKERFPAGYLGLLPDTKENMPWVGLRGSKCLPLQTTSIRSYRTSAKQLIIIAAVRTSPAIVKAAPHLLALAT